MRSVFTSILRRRRSRGPSDPYFPSLSLSPLQEICINMHDLNKSIRVNNNARQPQPGMGYGPHRGNPEDPVAAAQGGGGGGGYVRLPPNSMSSLPKQLQQQQGRPGYPHDDYMHPHHAAAAAAQHAYYGGEQGPPPPPPHPSSMPPLPPRQVPPQAAEGAVSAAAHASAVQQGRDSIRFLRSFTYQSNVCRFHRLSCPLLTHGIKCLFVGMTLANTLPLSYLPIAFQRTSMQRVVAILFDVEVMKPGKY